MTGSLVLWAIVPNQSYIPEFKSSLSARLPKGWNLEQGVRAAGRLLERALVATELAGARQSVDALFTGVPEVLRESARLHAQMTDRPREYDLMSIEDCRHWHHWLKEQLYGR